MTLYEVLKALAQYQKFLIKRNYQDIFTYSIGFNDMQEAIEYQDTKEEILLESLAEKQVSNINIVYGYIEIMD